MPSSDATAMAWNWVIQSIAKFNKVDSSTLAGLVKKAPANSVGLGKDAKEMVFLRMLESLFLRGNEATTVDDTDSDENANISVDPSEHCEEIMHTILEETSEPTRDLERRKRNIRLFISHKRASLPKTSVEKFKEALLDGSHPNLESLKEMSKLGGAKESENTTAEVNVYYRAKSPLKKSGRVEDSSRGVTGDIGEKEHETTIELTVEDSEEQTLVDHVVPIISKNLEKSCDHVSIDHGQQHLSGEDDDDERTDIAAKKEAFLSSCDHANIDHGQQQLPGEDDDDVDMADIAAKKEAFLSSQCTLSQDFMATVDFGEIFLCMKCSKGGQLLVCSSDPCPFRVHETCLGSAATFDESGAFFCPFCAYSHAISKYLEVKKKASLARKDLQLFLSSGVHHRPKISSKTGACLDENVSTKTGAIGEKFKLTCNEPSTSRGKHCAPVDDSLHPPTREAGMATQPSKEKESPVSSTCSRSKRTRKQEASCTSPTIALERRKNVFWETSEEEKLKEGLQRYACADNKRIPWKKILDFGQGVFHKSRTPINLKDKWRNMCRENPAIKKQKL